MASSINIAVYSDALVVLGTAGVVVPLVKRWGLSPVLGYLGGGMLLGPLGLGTFVKDVPLLYWFTVVDAKNVAGIADLGVVFLLFLIGLELSFERLKAMRRLVFGLGLMQVAVTTCILSAILVAMGMRGPVPVMLAACLALSSTAIVLEVLSSQGRLATRSGRTAFSVLLAQDLAVIPILIFVSILGAAPGSSVIATVSTAFFQAIAAVVIIVVVGRALLRPLFRLVAGAHSSELFIAAILFVIIATGVIAAVANLSMALGAFVAGLLLAETEYRKAVEATIEPFKGLLLGIFFFTIGMGVDLRELLREPIFLVACVAGLLAVKAAILVGLARAYGLPWPVAIENSMLLAPGGEFAFVGIGLAASLGVMAQPDATFWLAVVSVTMALVPLFAVWAPRIAGKLEAQHDTYAEFAVAPAGLQSHAIVVGYGRVGRVVCTLLEKHGVPHIAIDNDPLTVSRARTAGKSVYYGNATDPGFLRACGVLDARGIIVTIHDHERLDDIVREVRSQRLDVTIVARARDSEHARRLYGRGVTDAVPETIEASLQLSEAALVGLGVPTGPVIASIHEMRDEFRMTLQKAAREAGLTQTHSVKAKATPGTRRNTPPVSRE